jgi:hypothetical protein
MSGSSGWYTYLSIIREARDVETTLASLGPLSCPNDGEPLIEAPDGKLFCRFDGWRPSDG